MGGCNVCNNNGSIEIAFSEFFDNKNIRDLTIGEVFTKLKTKVKKGVVNESDWLKLIDECFLKYEKDKDKSQYEHYNYYFTEIYKKETSFLELFLALLFLCSKDTISLKLKFSDVMNILKSSEVITKTKDEKYKFINKDFIRRIVTKYCFLITQYAIKPVCDSKGFGPMVMKEIDSNYSIHKIDLYIKELTVSFINPTTETTENPNKNQKEFREKYNYKDFSIEDINGNRINLLENLDYDYFFENIYPKLCDDKKVREEIYLMGNKIQNLKEVEKAKS